MTLNRLPTVEEARAAVQRPLYESYWWFTGWNFNRPVMARVHVGVRLVASDHSKSEAFIIIYVGDNCPIGGFREDDLKHAQFEMRGPIELPEELMTE